MLWKVDNTDPAFQQDCVQYTPRFQHNSGKKNGGKHDSGCKFSTSRMSELQLSKRSSLPAEHPALVFRHREDRVKRFQHSQGGLH